MFNDFPSNTDQIIVLFGAGFIANDRFILNIFHNEITEIKFQVKKGEKKDLMVAVNSITHYLIILVHTVHVFEWNLSLTKGQGTAGKMSSLLRCFFRSKFFSIYFTINRVKKIFRYTKNFICRAI